jgi:hypothetical protein
MLRLPLHVRQYLALPVMLIRGGCQTQENPSELNQRPINTEKPRRRRPQKTSSRY